MSDQGSEAGGYAQDNKAEIEARPTAWQREQHEAHLRMINTLTDQFAANQKQQDRDEGKKRFLEKVTIVLVALTLAATGFGDWIFYNTMRDARDAAGHVRYDNKVGALAAAIEANRALRAANANSVAALNKAHDDSAAALQSADAGSQSALRTALAANSISQETANNSLVLSKSGERAWITPLQTRMTFNRANGGETYAQVYVQWQNTGRTPAQQIFVSISGNGTSRGDSKKLKGAILGPNQPLVSNYIPINMREAFLTRREYSIVSEITYKDILSDQVRHSYASYMLKYIGFTDPDKVDDTQANVLLSGFSVVVMETTGD